MGEDGGRAASRPTPRHSASARYTIAKPTRAFDANALQSNRSRQIFTTVLEELRLLGCADQPARQRPRFNPSALVKFPELRHQGKILNR